MTDAWRSIRLTEFEHVATGPTQSLLRVCGQTPPGQAPGPRPVLVIETAAGDARFHPLRAPDDLRGVVRAAYAVPTSLVTDGVGCWLQTSGGGRFELPAPVEGARRLHDDELFADQLIARAEAAEQAAQLAHSRVAALEADLAAQAPARESLREEIADLRARRKSLERELDQCRDELRLMMSERDEFERQAAAFDAVAVKARERATAAEAANEQIASTRDELEIWRAELERRLAETTTELGALRARRDTDERELDRLRSAVGEEGRHAGPPTGNGAESEAGHDELVAIQAQEIQRLAAELAELRSRAARGD